MTRLNGRVFAEGGDKLEHEKEKLIMAEVLSPSSKQNYFSNYNFSTTLLPNKLNKKSLI